MRVEKIKNNVKREKGITLVALVITIVVLIILASVSIGMLTGNNSITNQATDAKEQTERAEEKEILSISTAKAAGKDAFGNVEEDNLRNELNKYLEDYQLEKIGDNFKVTFPSNRLYIVDGTGKITTINTDNPVELVAKMTYVEGKYYIGVGFKDYQVSRDVENYYMKGPISGTLISPDNDKYWLSTENINISISEIFFDLYCYVYEIKQNGSYRFKFISDDGRYGEETIIIDNEHPQIVSNSIISQRYPDVNFCGTQMALLAGIDNIVDVESGKIDITNISNGITKNNIDLTPYFSSKMIRLWEVPELYNFVFDGEITFIYQGKEIKRKGTYCTIPS